MDDGANTALHYAAYSENLDMAKQLLKYGADIEAKNKVQIQLFLNNLKCTCLNIIVLRVSFTYS